MSKWLRDRSQAAPDPAAMHAMHAMPAMAPMSGMTGNYAAMGMATPEQMAAMAAAKGPAFDRLFLERMITHHQGARDDGRGPAQARRVGGRSGAVRIRQRRHQRAEGRDPAHDRAPRRSRRRSALKPEAGLQRRRSGDQRHAPGRLAAQADGFLRSGQPGRTAAPKPVDPKKPKPEKRKPGGDDDERVPAAQLRQHRHGLFGRSAGGRQLSRLQPLSSCGRRKTAADQLGHLPGRTRRPVDRRQPHDHVCRTEPRPRRLRAAGHQHDVSPERFRGIRIFDISDRARPSRSGRCKPAAARTPTRWFRPGKTARSSSMSRARPGPQGRGARRLRREAGDPGTALFRIDVVEIPVANPAQAARIIDRPAVFADPKSGSLAGLWRGGAHGEGTQETAAPTNVTTSPCSRPVARRRRLLGQRHHLRHRRSAEAAPDRRRVADPAFAYWHSATFNNDGTKVLFTDEWGGGARPRCRVRTRATGAPTRSTTL